MLNLLVRYLILGKSGIAVGTDTYTVSITSVSLYERLFITFANANTGASTLNVNSAGPIAITVNSAAISSGVIQAGSTYILQYNGTSFELSSALGITAGNYINVYWDDTNEAIEVQNFDDENDTTGTVITTGPDIGAGTYDHEITEGLEDPNSGFTFLKYKYCDGEDLVGYFATSVFPYVAETRQPGHFQCVVGVVCDLQISDDFTVQPATDLTTPDGTLEVSATSSGGNIKFAINNSSFNHATQGQTSGLFPGLYPGEYTVTAKDDRGCVDEIVITVPVPDAHGVLYRHDFTDLNGIPCRVDILERGYSGSVIEVDGGDDPVVLKYNGDGEKNKFYPIIASELRVTLWSPTSFFYRNLFTQDERKYQVKWYQDTGGSEAGFTPATLDALNLWNNISGEGVDWVQSLSPTVQFDSGFGDISSDFYKTAYLFEAGRIYTFGYEFEALGASGAGTVYAAATFEICILDASNNVIDHKYVNVGLDGLVTNGTYTFVAPSGATGIALRVHMSSTHLNQQYRVNEFINNTVSIPTGNEGLALKWLGYILPAVYKEPYIKGGYHVTIVATDGLADLKQYDFLDSDGNKYREDIITLEAIAEILSKTDLGINIQCAINRFEDSMTTSAIDDPFPQCMYNPETFYKEGEISNCLDVLKEILKPFGGVIKQRLGKWFIHNPEELVHATSYREFSSDGILITTGSVNDVVDISVNGNSEFVLMEGQAQMLEVVPSYRNFYFEHTLLKHSSLIKSYSFEEDDLIIIPPGIKVFKDWTVNLSNAPGAETGVKKTKSLDGEYNFYILGLQRLESYATLGSKTFQIEYHSTDIFELSFDYAILLLTPSSGTPPNWVRIKWQLRIGDYYFNAEHGWTSDPAVPWYNDIYVDRFNDGQNFKIRANFRNAFNTVTENVYVQFILEGGNLHDFHITSGGDYSELESVSTNNIVGQKLRGLHDQGSNASIERYYVCKEGEETESPPDIIVPNDFASDNHRYWELEASQRNPKSVSYIYLDNVVLLHYPKGEEAPDNVTIERTNNAGIKTDFEESYLLNDIDIDNINNSERTYKNFFKKLDGTPTQNWSRTYRAGEGKLLELLSNDVLSQYKKPSNKITGSFLFKGHEILPTTILNETADSNKKYMFMGYELHAKHAIINFDILELRDVVTDSGSDDIDAAFTTGFTLGFKS